MQEGRSRLLNDEQEDLDLTGLCEEHSIFENVCYDDTTNGHEVPHLIIPLSRFDASLVRKFIRSRCRDGAVSTAHCGVGFDKRLVGLSSLSQPCNLPPHKYSVSHNVLCRDLC
jgi:hypothetical protein